ncbi:MAG: hypothetical protein KBA91_03415 [Candidatus Moranbacteria bacterium]|jgi:hypothetical protein|nr:hypothetical protein [Candidatus Moranbacteria bacterium]
MDNKKIPTSIGAIVLVIIAITAGMFVWVYEKGQGWDTEMAVTQLRAAPRPVAKNNEQVFEEPQTKKQPTLNEEMFIDDSFVSGIKNVEWYKVDYFLFQNAALLPDTIDLIKKKTGYERSRAISAGSNSWILLVKNSIDSDVVYFLSTDYDLNPDITQSNVYSLNLKTSKVEELHDLSVEFFRYRLVGIQKDRLILFKMIRDSSPGPCYNSWVDAFEHPLPRPENLSHLYSEDAVTMKYLDLNKIKDGLLDFSIPKEKYLYEEEKAKECKRNFSK